MAQFTSVGCAIFVTENAREAAYSPVLACAPAVLSKRLLVAVWM